MAALAWLEIHGHINLVLCKGHIAPFVNGIFIVHNAKTFNVVKGGADANQ